MTLDTILEEIKKAETVDLLLVIHREILKIHCVHFHLDKFQILVHLSYKHIIAYMNLKIK